MLWYYTMIEAMFQNPNYVLGKKLMDVSQLRHKALSGNLANIETPGYKRVDVAPSFEQSLMRSVENGNFEQVKDANIQLKKDEQTPATRPDGNNVSLNEEMMQMNQNAMQYEFLTQYTSSNINSLNKAIRGRF